MKNVPKLPRGLFEGVGKTVVVVDTCNYYPRQRDGRIPAIEAGTTESRWVEQQLGHPVIKAFNNIYAQHLMELGRPASTPRRIALPVAGDDETAKGVVLRLVEELGFDAVDAGGLDESWRQQPGSPVYTKDFEVADHPGSGSVADHKGVREDLFRMTCDMSAMGVSRPVTLRPYGIPRRWAIIRA